MPTEERKFAGARHGDCYRGMFRYVDRCRLTTHWIDNGAGRFIWCRCMPAFRIGDRVVFPRQVKGRKAKVRYQKRAWRPYWHRERAKGPQ